MPRARQNSADPPPRPALGFRTYADDTPRADLFDRPPEDPVFADPEVVDLDAGPEPAPDFDEPEAVLWEAPEAFAGEPEAEAASGPPWRALLVAGAAVAALAVAWSAGLVPHTPAVRPPPPAMQVAQAAPIAAETVAPAPDRAAPEPRSFAGRMAQARRTLRHMAALGAPQVGRPVGPLRAPAAVSAEARLAEAAPPVAPPDTAASAESAGRFAGTAEPDVPAAPARAPVALRLLRPLDCAAIRSAAQDVVCRDPGLMAAERRMARAYAAALAAGAPEPALREDQDDWRAIREQAARRSKQAVEDIYHQRIEELESAARQP